MKHRQHLTYTTALTATALLATGCSGLAETESAPTVTVTATATATVTVTATPEPETREVTDLDSLVEAWEKGTGTECGWETPEDPNYFAEATTICGGTDTLTYYGDTAPFHHIEDVDVELQRLGKQETWFIGEDWSIRALGHPMTSDTYGFITTIGGDIAILG